MGEREVRDPDEDGQDQHGHQNHARGTYQLFAGRPRHLLHLRPHFRYETPNFFYHFSIPGQEGLEPPTSGFGDRRSSQLELLA